MAAICMFMPGVEFFWAKNKTKILLFFKWKVFKTSKIAQIYYYDPQSAGINVQSLQSESTPRRLTLLFYYLITHISRKTSVNSQLFKQTLGVRSLVPSCPRKVQKCDQTITVFELKFTVAFWRKNKQNSPITLFSVCQSMKK